jgi:hypothetical protein
MNVNFSPVAPWGAALRREIAVSSEVSSLGT